MKFNTLSLLLFLLPAISSAQAAVYECPGKDGPVFTDTPCSDGNEMNLPPPNVIDTATPTQQQPADQVAAPAYTAFSILQPEEQGTVHTNTGEFDVSLSLTAELQDGHAIRVSLDGTSLPTLRTSLQLVVTPDEWEISATDTTQHTLTATVVDQSGNQLITTPPVQFFSQRATVSRQRR